MTAEDTGLQVEAENKVTVHGGHRGLDALTLADLRVAVRELTSRGVPADARVDVTMNTTGTRWSVTAKWEPLKLPEDTTPAPSVDPSADAYLAGICGKCGRAMKSDAQSPSGWTHLDPLSNKHPAVKGRPVRDTPQA